LAWSASLSAWLSDRFTTIVALESLARSKAFSASSTAWTAS
jgi:hypothetical protein